MQLPAVTIIQLSPEQLEQMMERAAERGATRAAAAKARPAKLDSKAAALLLGKVHEDGSANLQSLNAFLGRHADCPVERVGRRLVFDRVKLEQWIAQRRRGPGGPELAAPPADVDAVEDLAGPRPLRRRRTSTP